MVYVSALKRREANKLLSGTAISDAAKLIFSSFQAEIANLETQGKIYVQAVDGFVSQQDSNREQQSETSRCFLSLHYASTCTHTPIVKVTTCTLIEGSIPRPF